MMLRDRNIGNTWYSQLVQVGWVAEAVGVSNKLDHGRKGMPIEDVPCGHVLVAESVASMESLS